MPLINLSTGMFGQLLEPPKDANQKGVWVIRWKKSTIFRNKIYPKELLLGGEEETTLVPKSAFFSLQSKDTYNQWLNTWYIVAELNKPSTVLENLIKIDSNIHRELIQKNMALENANTSSWIAQATATELIEPKVEARVKNILKATANPSDIIHGSYGNDD